MKAECVLTNGKIYSVSADGSRMAGEAVAISGGRIIDCGTDEKIKGYIDENTNVIDCRGGSILPGFTDGHMHAAIAAGIFENCSFFDIMCREEETAQDAIDKYVGVMKDFIESNPGKSVYRGTGWNRAFFTGGCREPKWPTRHDLDSICRDKPIVLESYCQHVMWTNTKAIELAGLDANTPDPETGGFTRDENGYPDGIFFEMNGINLIKENMPGYDYSVEQYKESFLKFQEEIALPYGVVAVNDCISTENFIEAMKQLALEDRLNMRVRGCYSLDNVNNNERIAEINARKGSDNISDMFGVDTVKIFFDGEFALKEPYEAAAVKERGLPEDYCGECFYSDEEAAEGLAEVMKTGLQIHIHAMGDKATAQAVQGLAYAQDKTGLKKRNVIAHLMLIDDKDAELMGKSEIMGNVQPRWMVYDLDCVANTELLFGRERSMKMYPYKKFLDAGCRIACGTDFPIIPSLSPFEGIECAVTRCIYEGAPLYDESCKGIPLGSDNDPQKECVGLQDVIRSYTYEGAYQNFLENETGSIEKGKSAELVVLDCDIENIPVGEIHNIQPEITIFKGEVVYRR